jgi:hypothetical protein
VFTRPPFLFFQHNQQYDTLLPIIPCTHKLKAGIAYRAFAFISQGPTQQKPWRPSFELEHQHGGCDVMCKRSIVKLFSCGERWNFPFHSPVAMTSNCVWGGGWVGVAPTRNVFRGENFADQPLKTQKFDYPTSNIY